MWVPRIPPVVFISAFTSGALAKWAPAALRPFMQGSALVLPAYFAYKALNNTEQKEFAYKALNNTEHKEFAYKALNNTE